MHHGKLSSTLHLQSSEMFQLPETGLNPSTRKVSETISSNLVMSYSLMLDSHDAFELSPCSIVS